jgi:hypothetical protein|tara:strand:- start:163076 stop:163279 length:204 start_codon:yes stop_codon:yes gene_type:complete
MASEIPEERDDAAGRDAREDDKERERKRDMENQNRDRIFGASLRRLYDDALDEPLTQEFQELLAKLK